MKIHNRMIILVFLFILQAPLLAATPSELGAKAYILAPANGEVVSSPVKVQFGLTGMGVAPAGVTKSKTGHHHLLVDAKRLPQLDQPIPSDKNHRHFGGGQTEAWIELSPGEHTLQLLLGDQGHVPHSPAVFSEVIHITVK